MSLRDDRSCDHVHDDHVARESLLANDLFLFRDCSRFERSSEPYVEVEQVTNDISHGHGQVQSRVSFSCEFQSARNIYKIRAKWKIEYSDEVINDPTILIEDRNKIHFPATVAFNCSH